MPLSIRITYLATILLIAVVLSPSARAVVIFEDNFNDGTTDGWSFHRNDASEWGIDGGVLRSSIGSDDNHDPSGGAPSPGLAVMIGVVTPDHFRLEADISVVHYESGGTPDPDRGHVGFGWGIANPDSATTSINQSYLRTHSDHVTAWSTLGAGSFGELIYNVGGTTNGTTYHLSLEVDFSNSTLTSIFTNGGVPISQTFSGASFTAKIKNTGGSIGLLNWGEDVSYDNVVLHALSVPAPGPFSLLVLGVVLCFRSRRC